MECLAFHQHEEHKEFAIFYSSVKIRLAFQFSPKFIPGKKIVHFIYASLDSITAMAAFLMLFDIKDCKSQINDARHNDKLMLFC